METRADQIRAFIQERIRQKAAASRQTPPALDDSLNLVRNGLVRFPGLRAADFGN